MTSLGSLVIVTSSGVMYTQYKAIPHRWPYHNYRVFIILLWVTSSDHTYMLGLPTNHNKLYAHALLQLQGLYITASPCSLSRLLQWHILQSDHHKLKHMH